MTVTAAIYDIKFIRELANRVPYEPLSPEVKMTLQDISRQLPASIASYSRTTTASSLFGGKKSRQPTTPPPTVLTPAKDDPAAKVRLLLNKLTDKNYDEYCNTIIRTLTLYDITAANADEIISIALNNQFYIKMYARLYASILADSRLSVIFRPSLDQFINTFKTSITIPIVYVTPNENYDRFCEMNAEIAKRKATTEFLVNLANIGAISYDEVFDVVQSILHAVAARLYDETAKAWMDDLCEHVFIICTDKDVVSAYQASTRRDGTAFMDNETGMTYNLVGFVGFLTKCSIKNQKGLTSKSKFKYTDTYDAMKLIL